MLPRDVLGASDGFEEFELRELMVTGVSRLPLRHVWQEDATGKYITLAEISTSLHKMLEGIEETVGRKARNHVWHHVLGASGKFP